MLRLSAQGEALHARIAPIALDTEQRLLASLNARERAELDTLIDRLLAASRAL
jgi:DNA-binding MarR family transcriptional regulator